MGRVKCSNSRRKFRGNKHVKITYNASESESVLTPRGDPNPTNTSVSTPPSASKKKLTYLLDNPTKKTEPSASKSEGNIIIDISVLSTFINKHVACSNCQAVNSMYITEEMKSRRGLSTRIKLECKLCKYVGSTMTSGVNNSKVSNVNIRLNYAMRCIGKGRQAARSFCAVMNLPPPVNNFNRYNSILHRSLEEVAEGSMWRAAKETKEMEGSADITVIIDGSWQRRGFSSLHGVVTATSLVSGKVLDFASYSKYCAGCVKKGDHKCTKNFNGYSGGMEVEGALELCRRSEVSRGLRYVRYLGDGDSKGHLSVVEAKPYGDSIKIEKLECVGHVQKRMGRQLRKLCQEMKGKKLSDGKSIGGRGRLTAVEIDKLQIYYGMAICENVGSLKNRRDAVWASYYHKYSTDDSPNHDLCPKGPTSWCGYQKAITNGTEYHHKHSLPSSVLDAVRPIYSNLSDEKLLSKCLHGKTQNQNEAFNACIWERVPKTVFVGARTIKIGVLDSLICFNDGSHSRTHVMKAMDIEPGENMICGLRDIDSERVAKAEKAAKQMTKEARTQRRAQKRKREDQETQEEDCYSPGVY